MVDRELEIEGRVELSDLIGGVDLFREGVSVFIGGLEVVSGSEGGTVKISESEDIVVRSSSEAEEDARLVDLSSAVEDGDLTC